MIKPPELKGKRRKYGIKVWVAADVEHRYTYNYHGYAGKIYDHPEKKRQGQLYFYTDFELIEDLLKHKLTLTRTLRKNKPWRQRAIRKTLYKCEVCRNDA
ncbi:hypothetical protein T03_5567 [Trichinella britovi]|uniref:PiggyBac transposable element-derived protein domain-containing protein n=1 Tax=Trichinella britovi TaxID=45882 RepID=A0A0V1CTW2_TRIBR|nr:hypothetical protein T03_5567 [Trichinella britovi]